LEIKDQLKEYVDRGPALANFSMLDFFLDTYDSDQTTAAESGKGRKPNNRVPYADGTGHKTRCRVIQSEGHETMPNFVSDWFPRNDVPELQQFYCASMLALLRPWTDIGDLKKSDQTFKQAFDNFVASAGQDTRHTLDNIQYQHESTDSAQQKCCDQQKNRGVVPFETNCNDSDPEPYLIAQQDTEDTLQTTEFNQRDVKHQLAAQFSSSDKVYAEAALNIAMDQGIFDEQLIDTEWKDVGSPTCKRRANDRIPKTRETGQICDKRSCHSQ
jgi:hypothetical protein